MSKVYEFPVDFDKLRSEGWSEEKAEKVIAAFGGVFAANPAGLSLGICFEAGMMYRSLFGYDESVCMCGITLELFGHAATGTLVYPLHTPARQDVGWEVRKQWCKVFVDGLESGVLRVPAELMETLKAPKY